MNVSDLNSFKAFARPVLQRQRGLPETTLYYLSTLGGGIMDSIFQFLMNRSKLHIELVHITNATPDGYTIRIETRVTGTGPVSSVISPMEMDISYQSHSFGRLKLPEFQTHYGGTLVQVPEQSCQILDMGTYMDYVKAVINQDQVQFQLQNGVCKVKAMGIRATCDFHREFTVAGMNGPKGVITNLKREGGAGEEEELLVTVRCHNPSPVEIDQGMSIFEFRNDQGQSLAEVRGSVNIVRGDFDVVLRGRMKHGAHEAEGGGGGGGGGGRGPEPTTKMRFRGIGAEGGTWCNETAKFVDVEVDVSPDYLDVLRGKNRGRVVVDYDDDVD